MKQLMLAGLILLAATAANAGVIIGAPATTDNCIPFGCASLFSIGTYQQSYGAGEFAGPLAIGSITFFNTLHHIPGEPSAIASGNYEFRFSTRSGPLSLDFGSNIGPDDQLFYSGTLPAVFSGDQFTVTGAPFSYNPALGDLLLTVYVTGAGPPSGTFLDASSHPAINRVYGSPAAAWIDLSYGLVTEFDVVAIPEPATWFMTVSGMGILAALRRRRRRN